MLFVDDDSIPHELLLSSRSKVNVKVTVMAPSLDASENEKQPEQNLYNRIRANKSSGKIPIFATLIEVVDPVENIFTS